MRSRVARPTPPRKPPASPAPPPLITGYLCRGYSGIARAGAPVVLMSAPLGGTGALQRAWLTAQDDQLFAPPLLPWEPSLRDEDDWILEQSGETFEEWSQRQRERRPPPRPEFPPNIDLGC